MPTLLFPRRACAKQRACRITSKERDGAFEA